MSQIRGRTQPSQNNLYRFRLVNIKLKPKNKTKKEPGADCPRLVKTEFIVYFVSETLPTTTVVLVVGSVNVIGGMKKKKHL